MARKHREQPERDEAVEQIMGVLSSFAEGGLTDFSAIEEGGQFGVLTPEQQTAVRAEAKNLGFNFGDQPENKETRKQRQLEERKAKKKAEAEERRLKKLMEEPKAAPRVKKAAAEDEAAPPDVLIEEPPRKERETKATKPAFEGYSIEKNNGRINFREVMFRHDETGKIDRRVFWPRLGLPPFFYEAMEKDEGFLHEVREALDEYRRTIDGDSLEIEVVAPKKGEALEPKLKVVHLHQGRRDATIIPWPDDRLAEEIKQALVKDIEGFQQTNEWRDWSSDLRAEKRNALVGKKVFQHLRGEAERVLRTARRAGEEAERRGVGEELDEAVHAPVKPTPEAPVVPWGADDDGEDEESPVVEGAKETPAAASLDADLAVRRAVAVHALPAAMRAVAAMEGLAPEELSVPVLEDEEEAAVVDAVEKEAPAVSAAEGPRPEVSPASDDKHEAAERPVEAQKAEFVRYGYAVQDNRVVFSEEMQLQKEDGTAETRSFTPDFRLSPAVYIRMKAEPAFAARVVELLNATREKFDLGALMIEAVPSADDNVGPAARWAYTRPDGSVLSGQVAFEDSEKDRAVRDGLAKDLAGFQKSEAWQRWTRNVAAEQRDLMVGGRVMETLEEEKVEEPAPEAPPERPAPKREKEPVRPEPKSEEPVREAARHERQLWELFGNGKRVADEAAMRVGVAALVGQLRELIVGSYNKSGATDLVERFAWNGLEEQARRVGSEMPAVTREAVAAAVSEAVAAAMGRKAPSPEGPKHEADRPEKGEAAQRVELMTEDEADFYARHPGLRGTGLEVRPHGDVRRQTAEVRRVLQPKERPEVAIRELLVAVVGDALAEAGRGDRRVATDITDYLVDLAVGGRRRKPEAEKFRAELLDVGPKAVVIKDHEWFVRTVVRLAESLEARGK